ncbi:GTP 3',8-cyclase MoaA [soil metagenome]
MSPYDAPAPLARPAAFAGAFARPLSDGPKDGPMDGQGRAVRYLRLSVTDRCDLRCLYCMPQRMQFLPRAEVLTLEELDRVATAFIGLGVRKLRLTGGEPLIRKGVLDLIATLGRHLRSGALDELTRTTNATHLAAAAPALFDAGVRRVNVSLDSADPDTYRRLTLGGDLSATLDGVRAAQAIGIAVKLNAVALARDNRAELPSLVRFAHDLGCDLTLIEAMPMGEIEDRASQFVSLADVRRDLSAVWTLTHITNATGGPARWLRVEETGGRLGLITPLSDHFRDDCHRVRVTCTGTLHTCLGQDDATDLRASLREHPGDDGPMITAIRSGLATKPRGHDFTLDRGGAPAVARHMSTTGG